jgi:ferredoxin
MDTVIDTSCIVYKEMCPLREKAIMLEEQEIVQPDGTVGVISLPNEHCELCILCEMCENKCPLVCEAAIRVYQDEGILKFRGR